MVQTAYIRIEIRFLIETEEKNVKERLLDLLNHEKRGSFDDKTSTIIYNKNGMQIEENWINPTMETLKRKGRCKDCEKCKV
ncbi:hypothetical protein DRN76_05420 [Methanosarcinales archaeon]|nr:MAG: hypothetical protein DRN76_05420 [Methanosarcinales archaeon]